MRENGESALGIGTIWGCGGAASWRTFMRPIETVTSAFDASTAVAPAMATGSGASTATQAADDRTRGLGVPVDGSSDVRSFAPEEVCGRPASAAGVKCEARWTAGWSAANAG